MSPNSANAIEEALPFELMTQAAAAEEAATTAVNAFMASAISEGDKPAAAAGGPSPSTPPPGLFSLQQPPLLPQQQQQQQDILVGAPQLLWSPILILIEEVLPFQLIHLFRQRQQSHKKKLKVMLRLP